MFSLTDVDNVIFSELYLFHNGSLPTQGGGMNIVGGHNIVLEYFSVKRSIIYGHWQSINVNFCYLKIVLLIIFQKVV